MADNATKSFMPGTSIDLLSRFFLLPRFSFSLSTVLVLLLRPGLESGPLRRVLVILTVPSLPRLSSTVERPQHDEGTDSN